MKAVEEQSTGGIDITEFVPIAQVDPIYYAKAYYLAPDKGGTRAYHLLAAALRETGLCALAKYAARGKQYLVLIRPVDEGLVMQQLHYPSEVRAMKEVGIDQAEVREGELALAVQLVRQGAVETFDPGKYTDEVRDRIQALIDRKVQGQDITRAPAESPRAQVIDLMAALKESLGMPAPDPTKAATDGPEPEPSAAPSPRPKTAAGDKD